MTKIRLMGGTIPVSDHRTVKPSPKRADGDLLNERHRQWALAVKRRAGWRCEWVEAGQRCEVRSPARLFADHIIERADGGALLDPANGRCLCGSHHTRKTAASRATRLAERYGPT